MPRLILAGALLVALGAVALVLGDVGRGERAIAAQGARAVRRVTYVLRPRETLRVQLDAGTDLVRLVAHAVARSGLLPSPPIARVSVELSGGREGRDQALALRLPGRGGRASLEQDDAAVSDPLGVNLDVRSTSGAELLLRLDGLENADALLLRFYARERRGLFEAWRSFAFFGARAREHMARRAGELDWVDLGDDARMLVSGRWRKLGAVNESGQPAETRAIMLTRPVAATLEAPPSAEPSPVDPEPSLRVPYVRATRATPVLVVAGARESVLRIAARVPLPLANSSPPEIAVDVAIEEDGKQPQRVTARARAHRASGDIYAGAARDPASERLLFHVLLPARTRVRLAPLDGYVDLSLSELDPLARPRAHATPVDGATLDPHHVLRADAFVPRLATNAREFAGADAHGLIHLAPRGAGEHAPDSKSATRLRVSRPNAGPHIARHGLWFASAREPLRFDLKVPEPRTLPLRVYAAHPTEVLVEVDGDAPRRRPSGLAAAVTTPHLLAVDGETRFTLRLGDDLAPGPHRLRLASASGEPLFVHAPWSNRSVRHGRSGWLVGDFEP